jgi:hypothetical protein
MVSPALRQSYHLTIAARQTASRLCLRHQMTGNRSIPSLPATAPTEDTSEQGKGRERITKGIVTMVTQGRAYTPKTRTRRHDQVCISYNFPSELTSRADGASPHQHHRRHAAVQRALTFFIPGLGGIFTSGKGFPFRFRGWMPVAADADSPSEPSPSTAFSNACAACGTTHS